MNNVQEIVWIIEEKVMQSGSSNNNNSAIKEIRNANCLRDDFRMVNIVKETFNYLTSTFKRHEGKIMLTNTNMNVGEIFVKHLGLENTNIVIKMKLGCIVLNALIDQEYLILTRESFYTIEEIMENGKKRSVRLRPYHLEMGHKYGNIILDEKERIGISRHQYPAWKRNTRMVDGVKDRLIKSSIKEIDQYSDYVKAVNRLEKVKWSVNASVAKVSELMEDKLTETILKLKDKDNNDVYFDARDIRRENINKEYIDVDLYRDGSLFEPDKGNATTVKTIEDELNKEEKRVNSLKKDGKALIKCKRKINKLNRLFDRHNLMWTAKQLCLATQSKSARNHAILNSIHGSNGWASYTFYLSMFLDFRGRVYARDPYFSYQSSDLARGHLQFHEKQLVTEKGFKHILIHAANSYNQSYTIKELKELTWTKTNYVNDLVTDGIPDLSVDIMSLIDRQEWSEQNTELFWSIVDDPIATQNIWMQAEKPWVFLSICFEICSYHGSILTGEDHYSNLPIAIDGSSNGTQHLAAMSKDEIAGRMVGLTEQEKPIDFYIVVAKGILNRNIESDLGEILSKIPMKLIRKGISKRGTMTKAYDAGVKCIADIIYMDCYDAGMTTKYGITKTIAKKLSKDLVETYNTICSGPVSIKNYLQALVKHRVSKQNEDTVCWMSPSGFPCVSEKWIMNKKKIELPFTSGRIQVVVHEQTTRPAMHEMISGISPNYVHSMDAAHMSLVIVELEKAGILSFGAIHDSFSVHAERVDELLDITKETFINIYDKNIFKDMRNEIISNDPLFVESEPTKGKLDLLELMKSDYFFC